MSTKRPDSAPRIFSAPAVRSSRADRGLCADREESFLMYWGLFLFSQNVIYDNSAQNQGDQKTCRSLCICGCEYEAKKAEPRTKNAFWVQPGAADRDRTGTVLPPRDFKSLASANSATAAQLKCYFIIQYPPGKVNTRGGKLYFWRQCLIIMETRRPLKAGRP